ncbi:hypothetical protein MAPG_07551 [Magnaporthiopsis poae ATCC 64411]|uniref:Uncharacterized protein n=1 Tax=Magnaporthiopsis poae (strain ATCC 64411 / 73-15) TaxID=644358 RepID=A0A0C4E4Z4_MAGP6|nr:hypothetical protein MAPG_07551 [Magnaporthiopsis poae ATCC 64411]
MYRFFGLRALFTATSVANTTPPPRSATTFAGTFFFFFFVNIILSLDRSSYLAKCATMTDTDKTAAEKPTGWSRKTFWLLIILANDAAWTGGSTRLALSPLSAYPLDAFFVRRPAARRPLLATANFSRVDGTVTLGRPLFRRPVTGTATVMSSQQTNLSTRKGAESDGWSNPNGRPTHPKCRWGPRRLLDSRIQQRKTKQGREGNKRCFPPRSLWIDRHPRQNSLSLLVNRLFLFFISIIVIIATPRFPNLALPTQPALPTLPSVSLSGRWCHRTNEP